MAFVQTPVNLQGIATVTSELWPSVSSAFAAPLRGATSQKPLKQTTVSRQQAARYSTAPEPVIVESCQHHSVSLPECFRSVPSSSLSLLSSSATVRHQNLGSIIDGVPRNALWAASPVANRLLISKFSRQFSTKPDLQLGRKLLANRSNGLVNALGRRAIFSGTTSRNLLAHMEQTANNNPQSATAQNAFYQALLRANMPEIVVERYQTGRFASNAACEMTYVRALEKLGQTEKAQAIAASRQQESHMNAFSNEQIRATGQAVAATSRGGNIALGSGKNGTIGTGGKESPLYVVVEESMGGAIFKWAKFLLYFGLTTYLALVLLTFMVDATGMLKKMPGTQNNEAQPQHQTARFSDVHGCEEAKEELQELVEFLKNPEKFSSLGGKLPKGVLLVGPPGTGKTLLARAVAGEAGVPFFFMSGSEFDEVYVGVGAKRVRDLFNNARAKAPAIVFIDELDAIGGKRNERDAAYVKQTLNQLLTELDGFAQNSGVIILAATNFPQLLDKALTRPGRFDRNVVVPLPDVRGRMAILNHHMKSIQVGEDVDAEIIARGTPGFSGAELENIINQAAVHASRRKASHVAMLDVEWAKDKIMMGAERRSAVIQMKDKINTAYHEGGHALVAMFTEGADPLYKATIMPRGPALGITYQLPEIDKVSMAKKEYLARIDVCMGGKVAEELVFGPDNVTGGASNDIQQATSIAFAMVTQMGMSDTLGNVDLSSDYARLSSETKQEIEKEVRRIIDEGRERATKLLTTKRAQLDILAKALIEYEVLNRDEMERVVRGEKLPDKLKLPPEVPIKLPELPLRSGISPPAGVEAASGLEARPGTKGVGEA